MKNVFTTISTTFRNANGSNGSYQSKVKTNIQ